MLFRSVLVLAAFAQNLGNCDDSCLVDLKSYKILTSTDKMCEGNPDLLITVSSAANHTESRDVIRKSWGNWKKYLSNLSYRVVFVLGLTMNATEQKDINAESEQHNDIIQADFLDSYQNLTYKSIFSLKWAEEFCASANFVLKVDDDVYINIFTLATEIEGRFGLSKGSAHLICCGHIFHKNEVIRDEASKYHVSREEWLRDGVYPPFCSGAAYMVSRDVSRDLVRLSTSERFFKLDDVFITAVLRQRLGILLNKFEGGLEWQPSNIQKTIEYEKKPSFLFGLTKQPKEIKLLWRQTLLSM